MLRSFRKYGGYRRHIQNKFLIVVNFDLDMEPADRRRQIEELRANVSASICRVLTDRILALEPFGLASLWVNADSNDEFNAGTVLGYSSDDWKSVQLHSGLR